MLSLVAIVLALSPTMAGPPVATRGSSLLDYTTSLFLTDPSGAQLCADANITTDQGAAITVTRATTTTCEIAAGNVVSISANRPSVEADGLNVWPASSNRVINSDIIAGNWTPTNAAVGANFTTSPTGNAINNMATTVAGGYFESDVFTITGTSAVLSIFVKGAGGETANVVLRDTTAGTDRCTITPTVTSSWPSMKTRPSCNSAAIVSGNNHVVRVYPGGTAGSTSTDIYFAGAQVEPALTVMTPYMPTTATVATRNADNISTTIADINATGCFGATFWTTVAAFPRSIATNPATLAQYNNTTTMLANDGTNNATSNAVSNMTDRSESVRAIWGGSTFKIGLGGSLGSNASYDGSMSGTTTLYIGSLSGTSRHFGGWIKKMKVSTDLNGCTP